MTMQFSKKAATSVRVPKGYQLLQSEFGGFYYEVGDEASEDFRSRRQAIAAIRAHRREAMQLAQP